MAEWWATDVPESVKFSLEASGKIQLLASILKKCESIGDKMLVGMGRGGDGVGWTSSGKRIWSGVRKYIGDGHEVRRGYGVR